MMDARFCARIIKTPSLYDAHFTGFERISKDSMSNFRFVLRLKYTVVFAATLTLLACGGGGTGSVDVPVVGSSSPTAQAIALDKSVYFAGDIIAPGGTTGATISSAALLLADGGRVPLPLSPKGQLIAPVIPKSFAGVPVRLSVSTSSGGVYESAQFTLQPLPVTSSKPGVVTLTYLNVAIERLSSGIQADTLKVDSGTLVSANEKLKAMRIALEAFRDKVFQAQNGGIVEIANSSAQKSIVLDAAQLEIFDQYILAITKLTLRSLVPVLAVQLPMSASLPTKALFTQRPDCTTFAPSDIGFCENLRAQYLSNDLTDYANTANIVGGAVGAIAVVVGAFAAAPALVAVGTGIGIVTISGVIAANLVGAAGQAISAYNNGTYKGTDFGGYVKNLTGAARDLVTQDLAAVLTVGHGDAVEAVTGLIVDGSTDLILKIARGQLEPISPSAELPPAPAPAPAPETDTG